MPADDFDQPRLRPFIYVTVENAPFYRAIMRAFIDARERFTLHLRPADVTAALEPPTDTGQSIESALQQLCDWGNLERSARSSRIISWARSRSICTSC